MVVLGGHEGGGSGGEAWLGRCEVFTGGRKWWEMGRRGAHKRFYRFRKTLVSGDKRLKNTGHVSSSSRDFILHVFFTRVSVCLVTTLPGAPGRLWCVDGMALMTFLLLQSDPWS